MTTLSVEDLVVDYTSDGYCIRALDHLSFGATSGELVVLLGPSGSGKTSLLSCLAGILTPTSGSIRFDELAVTALRAEQLTEYRRSHVGIVFQAFNLIPSATARENVAAPLLLAGQRRRGALARADHLLRSVGLSDRARMKPGRLSGGQQQRVALARALALDPPMVLADEPTANLDYVNAESIISLLRNLRSEGRLIIVSTHDQRIVPIADRVVHMVAEPGSASALSQRVQYAAGERIFEQGSRGEWIYAIESGQVEIVRVEANGGESLLALMGPGQYFGDLAPLMGTPRSASAVAHTDVVLTALGVRAFREQVLGQSAMPVVDGAVTVDVAELERAKASRPAAARGRRPGRGDGGREKRGPTRATR
jgi:putative ABC transport system ATP-binding protein